MVYHRHQVIFVELLNVEGPPELIRIPNTTNKYLLPIYQNIQRMEDSPSGIYFQERNARFRTAAGRLRVRSFGNLINEKTDIEQQISEDNS